MHLLIMIPPKSYRFVTGFDLQSKRFKDYTLLGVIRGNYPSLNVLKLEKKTPDGFTDYLKENIAFHKNKVEWLENQLRNICSELGDMNV